MKKPELDLRQVAEWVALLCPPGTPGLLWVGSKSSNFKGRRFVPATQLTDLLIETKNRDRDPGVFLRMGTIKTGTQTDGRGSLDDSETLFALWADIDIDGPGHKHDPAKYEGRRLPPDEDTARRLVEHLPPPTVWVRSGGGLYPMWLPQRPWLIAEHPDLGQLSADLQVRIQEAATALGYHYGAGIGDLARILRIPGTVNRKVPGSPTMCEVLPGGSGRRYTYEELRAVVPVVQKAPTRGPAAPSVAPLPRIPTAPRTTTRLAAPKSAYDEPPGAVGPLDDFARRHDLGSLLEDDGWTFAYEHQGRRHYARPGKSPRDGVSGNVYSDQGRQVLYVFSEEAGLPTMRGLSAGDWYAHRHHGGDLRETARALRQAGYGTPPTTYPVSTGSVSQAAGVSTAPAGLPVPLRTVVEGTIWNEREVFARVRQAARARMVGPWAVLGSLMAQVVCRIGPHVVLPAIIGGVGSLNLFVGLVGKSGAGKDAAMAVAEELLDAPRLAPKHELGTGQGIDASYTMQTKEGPVQFNDTVLWELSEIDTLAAHGKMSGSTLMPTVRKLYTGKQLGAQYADQFKRRPVPQHGYRAAIVAGIQPERSDVLLNDAETAGGTPQRWLWLPTDDPEGKKRGRLVAPRMAVPVRWQDYEVWAAQGEQGSDPVRLQERTTMEVCAEAEQVILQAREEALGQTEEVAASAALDGHALFTRLKVAAVLALMEQRNRLEVTADDWRIAGMIMSVSDATRAECRRALRDANSKQSRIRGMGDAEREVAKTETVEDLADQKIAKVKERIVAKLQEVGDWMKVRDLRAFLGRDRGHLQAAMDELTTDGLLTTETVGTSTRCRVAAS